MTRPDQPDQPPDHLPDQPPRGLEGAAGRAHAVGRAMLLPPVASRANLRLEVSLGPNLRQPLVPAAHPPPRAEKPNPAVATVATDAANAGAVASVASVTPVPANGGAASLERIARGAARLMPPALQEVGTTGFAALSVTGWSAATAGAVAIGSGTLLMLGRGRRGGVLARAAPPVMPQPAPRPQPVATPPPPFPSRGGVAALEDEAWGMAQAQLRANIASRQRV